MTVNRQPANIEESQNLAHAGDVPIKEYACSLPITKFKEGDEVALRIRWEEPVDPDSELVGAAIELIKPKKNQESPCRDAVAQEIWLQRMLRETFKKKASHRSTILRLKSALLKVIQLLVDLPPSLRKSLFGHGYEIEREFEMRGLKFSVPKDESSSLRGADIELTMLLRSIERELSNSENRSGPKLDYCKLNTALVARDLLLRFGSKPPTKTVEGSFYRLASILHEAVTGENGVSLERQCRKALKSR